MTGDNAIGSLGLLGTGPLGLALGCHFTRAGMKVVLYDEDPRSARKAVATIGGLSRLGSFEETVSCEIVIATMAWDRLPDTVGRVRDWEDRILVDATNPSAGNGASHFDLGDRTSSEALADAATGARLVKAFNTLPAELLCKEPLEAGARRVLFYCGDHEPAKAFVGRLIAAIGFAGIDLGSLRTGAPLMRVPSGPLAMLNLLLHRLP